MSGVGVRVGLGVIVGVFVLVGVGVLDGVGDGVFVGVLGRGWNGVGDDVEIIAWLICEASNVGVGGASSSSLAGALSTGSPAHTICVGHSKRNIAAVPPIMAIVSNIIRVRTLFCQKRMNQL